MQRQLEEAKAREDGLRAEREQQLAAMEAARVRQAALARPAGAGALAANAKPAAQLATPVAGTLLRGWGDPEDGEPATGMSWQTGSGAEVVSPCNGTVVYADQFRGYGLLAIVDCGGGYHAVLSGLDKFAVPPGRSVVAGDNVGTMHSAAHAVAALPVAGAAAAADPAEARATTSDAPPDDDGAAPPVLYFELRKSGRPVNPAPWLRPAG
jgi:septal ring factor EnvC (AmiA/AmiB activator)